MEKKRRNTKHEFNPVNHPYTIGEVVSILNNNNKNNKINYTDKLQVNYKKRKYDIKRKEVWDP